MSCQLSADCASKYGGVAQLGERTVRIRKVKGSNPSVSTNVELYEHNTAKSVFILLRRASYSSPHFRVGDNKPQPSNLAAVFLYERANRI